MPIYKTSRGRRVDHCHLGQDECEDAPLSAERIERMRRFLQRYFRNVVEIAPPTNEFNCIGFALARSHGVFSEFEEFFNDDYDTASFGSPARGDVVRYNRSNGTFGHVGVVTHVSGGQISRVCSKWGYLPVLCHTLKDVEKEYGEPVALLRPRPGVGLPLGTLCDIEMPEPVSLASAVPPGDEEAMPEFKSVEEAMEWALGRISDPDVYIRVALASTPEMARVIIEDLPGVKDLIDIGPPAAPEILTLLQKAQEQRDNDLASVTLYLLQRIPTSDATTFLSDSLLAGRFTGFNLTLAADALLNSADSSVDNQNPITAALREAEKNKTPK